VAIEITWSGWSSGQQPLPTADCLDIKDMGNIATIKADDLELEDAGSDSDLTPIRLTGRNKILCFFFFRFLGWRTSPHVDLGSKSRQMPLNIASAYCLGSPDTIATHNF
jgi:hypothetical protein